MVLGDFEGVFFVCFYRLFSKQPLTKGLHFQCVCVLANNLQLLLVKREDP